MATSLCMSGSSQEGFLLEVHPIMARGVFHLFEYKAFFLFFFFLFLVSHDLVLDVI